MVVGRHPEPLADDRDRERLGEVVQQVEVAPFDERLEQFGRELRRLLPHRLHAPGRERRRDELADARVIGRLEPEEAPALDVPERLPARIERLRLELLLGTDVPEVAAQPPVAQTGADICVTRDEPAVELLVVEHGDRLAELRQDRVRIREKLRGRRVELHH